MILRKTSLGSRERDEGDKKSEEKEASIAVEREDTPTCNPSSHMVACSIEG